MSPPDLAVLFDMDGLLVDTEPVWFDVESEVFARLGGCRAWTHTDAQRLVGNALEVSASAIIRAAGSDLPPAVVTRWFVDGMADRLAAGVPWKPGATELLASLRTHAVPTALVSSSHRTLVARVLDQLPPGSFSASVAGDEVRRGKPDPEPYRRALSLVGVSATRAVALEDSPTGATAAAAAGCTVLVVPDQAPLPPDHGWPVVASLTHLDVAGLQALLGGDGGQHVEVRRSSGGQDRRENTDEG